MAKLGYTWYPKDWGNSESVFELNLSERGLYRELIDLAMMNDNNTEIKFDVWSRKFAINVDELKCIVARLLILNLVEIKQGSNSDILFIPSCESRLNLVRGGSKGGKNKPTIKPMPKPIVSLEEKNVKPMPKQREKEIETKIKGNNIEARTQLFKDECKTFIPNYGTELIKSFFLYWSEPNKTKTKMKYELQQTWDLSRRLATWSKNESNFKKPIDKPKTSLGI